MKKIVRLVIIAAIALLMLAWIVWSNVTIGVTHYVVSSNRLPKAFDHFRIAVISDLHNAEYGKTNSRLTALIEKEKPDMIAITGDLVDSSKTDIELAVNLVKKLVELAPCYYVSGNQEAHMAEQYQVLEEKLLEAGVVILHNRSINLTKNKETIKLAGLDDPNFTDRDSTLHKSILKTRLQEMDLTEDYCVLLSHRPETFSAYVSENIDLVLSGHTHGGQFRLPFIGGVAAPHQGFFPKYDAGEFFENHTTMIISRGIGNSIIPIRFNNRPELVIVELLCNQ